MVKQNKSLKANNLEYKKAQSNRVDTINKNKNQQKHKKDRNVNINTFKQNKNAELIQKNNNKNSQHKVQKDERFAKASYDPRFLQPKKEITKVKIDNRFSKMLTDPAFKNLNKVDKYGRKIISSQESKKKVNAQLQQYYTFDNQQDNEQQVEGQSDDLSNQQEDKIDQEEELQNEEQYSQNDQNQNDLKKWMEQYDAESSSIADMPVQEIMEDENQGPQVWSDDDQNVIKDEKVKPAKRLALCNYDWMNIASKDLMILFNSFKPAAGYIKSVKVYQSNIGKQKMEQQQMFGPQGIWNQNQEENFIDQQEKNSKKWRKSWKQLLNKQNSSALNNRKLRAYEKERLKYFYAVIQCDSKKTADQIYKECDGNHFQNSNLQFDLRFIPDDITFQKFMLKEQCNQMPVSGEVKNFVNRAMGHSKVELTWQDPQLSLPATLKKKNWGKMTEQELNKIDWGTYLNEEGVQQEQNKKQLFIQKQDYEIMPDWKLQCNKKYKNQNVKEQLIINFDTGFAGARGNKKSVQQAPSLKKQKKSKKQLWARAQQQRKKRRQELTLMTEQNQEEKQKNFKVNLNDQRFHAVYSNPSFSIDPSNPKFDHRRAGNVFKEVVERNRSKKLQ